MAKYGALLQPFIVDVHSIVVHLCLHVMDASQVQCRRPRWISICHRSLTETQFAVKSCQINMKLGVRTETGNLICSVKINMWTNIITMILFDVAWNMFFLHQRKMKPRPGGNNLQLRCSQSILQVTFTIHGVETKLLQRGWNQIINKHNMSYLETVMSHETYISFLRGESWWFWPITHLTVCNSNALVIKVSEILDRAST